MSTQKTSRTTQKTVTSVMHKNVLLRGRNTTGDQLVDHLLTIKDLGTTDERDWLNSAVVRSESHHLTSQTVSKAQRNSYAALLKPAWFASPDMLSIAQTLTREDSFGDIFLPVIVPAPFGVFHAEDYTLENDWHAKEGHWYDVNRHVMFKNAINNAYTRIHPHATEMEYAQAHPLIHALSVMSESKTHWEPGIYNLFYELAWFLEGATHKTTFGEYVDEHREDLDAAIARMKYPTSDLIQSLSSVWTHGSRFDPDDKNYADMLAVYRGATHGELVKMIEHSQRDTQQFASAKKAGLLREALGSFSSEDYLDTKEATKMVTTALMSSQTAQMNGNHKVFNELGTLVESFHTAHYHQCPDEASRFARFLSEHSANMGIHQISALMMALYQKSGLVTDEGLDGSVRVVNQIITEHPEPVPLLCFIADAVLYGVTMPTASQWEELMEYVQKNPEVVEMSPSLVFSLYTDSEEPSKKRRSRKSFDGAIRNLALMYGVDTMIPGDW